MDLKVREALGQMGALVVRLAADEREVAAAQAMRHAVFSEEFQDHGQWRDAQQDVDRYDFLCDHLIVIDKASGLPDHQAVVGTYRLLRKDQLERGSDFYSAGEFDIAPLLARNPRRRFLELGRSCVRRDYRSRRTLELLWQGIWAYCRNHGIDVMIGCASFPGTIPARHAEALSFLAQNCMAQDQWRVQALPERYQSMDLMPQEAVDPRRALAAMPPLIKGYLRLGASIGEGCVIDREFGTVDVFIVLPTEEISERYLQHYRPNASRFTG